MATTRARATRRRFLGIALAMPVALAAARKAQARPRPLALTPACPGGAAAPTAPQTEGPYFKPSSPRRASLIEPGVTGPRIVVTGLVLSTDCRPIPDALVDVWQADAHGEYDNRGYRLRGHQLTDAAGRYRLETIVPAEYPGRTRHIHVKVQAPRQRMVLTTQLYFPGEPANGRDRIFDPALVMKVESAAGGLVGAFDFVLPPAATRSSRRAVSRG
ncbi:MAG TPA: intradiol ring-cleavage dioxygenase [Candidatus Binatia bacterium]|nr:intradiol ring-cleavage dioxygenase [Candidatus Binatia bacterium]